MLVDGRETRRRTQAERSAETQDRILRAALDCIETMGLQNASTHEIAREAGVSRGAMLHHFPTRAALLEAAFTMLLEEEARRMDRFSESVARDGSSINELVDFIWERYTGPLFHVTLDFLALARVDDETLGAVIPGATAFAEDLNALWDKSLSGVKIPPDRKRALMNQTLFLIRGMAFQRIWRHEPGYFETVLSEWIIQLRDQLGLRA